MQSLLQIAENVTAPGVCSMFDADFPGVDPIALEFMGMLLHGVVDPQLSGANMDQ